MSVSVLSGFVSGQASTHIPHDDPRFEGLSQSDALESFDEQRQGCPLRVKTPPFAQKKRIVEHEIGEGLLSLPGSDFRDFIDRRESSQAAFDGKQIRQIGGIDIHELFDGEIRYAFCDGEVVIQNCPEDLVWRLQKLVGLTGIVALGQGFYDLFFPAECPKLTPA